MAAAGSMVTCFGREVELAALAENVERAVAGRFTGVLIEGAPGIGKSTVLAAHAAAERARRRQVAVAWATELERARPFGLLSQALGCTPTATDARARQIADLLAGSPENTTVTNDAGVQFQVADRFVDLIENRAMAQPLMLVLDDLQWADPASLLAVGIVARRLGHLPLAVVGALRAGWRTKELERFRTAFERVGGRSIGLGPLSPPNVRSLVAERAGAAPGERLWAAVERAAGNPLFVHELVTAVKAEGNLRVQEGVAEVGEAELPSSLSQTILQRVGFLPELTMRLLRTASVLGTGFRVGDLAEVSAWSVIDVATELESAFATGVLVDDGETTRFGHDLVRAAIYDAVPQSIRLGLHREAAARLAAADADPLTVAEQYRRSARRGDHDAVEWLTRASRRWGDLAPATSADLLEQAIDLLAPGDEEARARLGVERAGRLLWAGRIREAEALCRALAQGDRTIGGRARALLGRCLMADGRMDEAAVELESAEETSGLSGELRVAILTSASTAHLFAGRMSEAASAAERARAQVATIADSAAWSTVVKSQATIELFRGDPAQALRLADEAIAHANASVDRQGHRDVHRLVRGHALIELDRLDEAHATLETGMRLCEELGLRWSLGAYQLMVAVAHFTAGDWTTALGAIEAGEEFSVETGESYNVIAGHCIRGLIAWHRNDLTTAARAEAAALGEVDRAGPRYRHHWGNWLRSLRLEAEGQMDQAYACLAQTWTDLLGSGMAIEYAAIGPDLIRQANLVGDTRTGAEVVTVVSEVAQRNDICSLRAADWRCRGLHSQDPLALARAAQAYAETPRRLEQALALEDAGTLWALHGRRREGADRLGQALEIFEDLGADRDAGRTMAALRRIGVRRRARSPQAPEQTGWHSLTPAERRVVDLVVEGLTNPQIGERLFVSRRTVQTHLSHVFQKLEVSSRSELAAVAARRA